MTDACDEVGAAVIAVAPLLTALATPQRVAVHGDGVQAMLDQITGRLGLPELQVSPTTDGLTAAELLIGRRLTRAGLARAAQLPPDAVSLAVERMWRPPIIVHAKDGAVLRCHAAGPVGAPVVVLVSACGMPAGLVGRWMAYLSADHRVVTWESRGLFDNRDGFDELGYDLATQADDLVTVLESFDIGHAHVVGLCGGAAIALAAAPSPRVESLSLWHGDYELGRAAAKTTHQRDMQTLLVMAGRDRARAASLHRVFRRPSTLAALRPDLAHYLYYPYATAELLHRYGRLNGAIMTTDCRPLLPEVAQPTLVVTSHDDSTAHPDGSRYVASHLTGGELCQLPHGDHLAAFDARQELLDLATSFIADHGGHS